ncbi:glycosyltransferase family 2 protein [Falsirhodobacter deserti]|uniref:glycosyltransferase family 2 protein n=1 Tax=Falsirhodobacter deserti TaxID=1365611 RepID=UPI0013E3E1DD|nr:glycosyltransferase family 2 protein [Falsirhodobacter deserti]
MPHPQASIAVIVVNYGTADLAVAAVESVLSRTHDRHSVEVHLVDNASPGGDAETLKLAAAQREWGDRVVLWLEDENRGFGRGNNVVLEALNQRATPPDYIFLLNPDASLENDCLTILALFMDENPQVAAAGAQIVRPDVGAVTAAFRFPGMASEFCEGLSIGGVSRLFASRQVALPADLPRQKIGWASGAAVMIRFKAAREVGFFDPDFFLYYEETELMWRLHKAGSEIWFVPEARISHVAGAATGMQGGTHRSKEQPSYWYDSWRLYYVKTLGLSGARRVALARFLGFVVNAGVRTLMGRQVRGPLNFRRDFSRFVLRPLFLGNPTEAHPSGRKAKMTNVAS